MGVYIKGITLEQIKKCTLYTMDGGCIEFYDGRLIEVAEPHGRLIDADALINQIKQEARDNKSIRGMAKALKFEYSINEYVPTVIEAEGE